MVRPSRTSRFPRFPWRRPRQLEDEIDEELRFHLDMRNEELMNAGMTPERPRREAFRQFGNLEATRRALAPSDRRSAKRRRIAFLDRVRQDLRYASRSLRAHPGFTAISVLVLALGIGANTAVFSLVNTLLLRPRSVERPHELAGLYSRIGESPGDFRAFSYPEYRHLREENRIFSELLAHNLALVGLTEGETTRRVMASLVSANYFATFGVPMAMGRAFTLEEERPGSRIPAVILSHRLWEKEGADPGILGTQLRINGESLTVVGVAPPGFTGAAAIFSADLWLPLGMYGPAVKDIGRGDGPQELDDPENHALLLMGRLAAGIDMAAAGPEMERLAAQLEAAYPAEEGRALVLAKPRRLSISDSPYGESQLAAPVIMLMAMTGVVMLIACLNLANMLLARGSARRTEIAIRLSLGGGRMRLLQQLLTEGLVLSLLGGVAGLVLAFWATRLLVSSLMSFVPVGVLVLDTGPDLRVLAATIAFCAVSTLVFALGPAWKLTRPDLALDLKDPRGRDHGGTVGRGLLAPRNLMVLGQLALSMVLLIAAGLFLRGALRAAGADPGFSLDRGLVVELDPSLIGYDETRSRDTYRRLVARLRALPQVEAAGIASLVPFGPVSNSTLVQRADAAANDEGSSVSAEHYVIGSDYFEALGVPLLRGRELTDADLEPGQGPAVVIIDEPLARLLFPDADPLGQLVRLAPEQPEDEPVPMEIVGIAPGLRHSMFDAAPPPHVYVPIGQQYRANMHIHLRLSRGGPEAESAALAAVRREIRAVDDRLPVLTLETLTAFRDASVQLWAVQAGAKMFSLLGLLALFLAVVGVYGVKAYVVSRRTREIGIRMALGASRGAVLWLVLREGIVLSLVGLGAGLLLGAGAAQLLSSLLYEVSATDPLVYLAAFLVLASAALLAAYLPARRATRVMPTTALRYE